MFYRCLSSYFLEVIWEVILAVLILFSTISLQAHNAHFFLFLKIISRRLLICFCLLYRLFCLFYCILTAVFVHFDDSFRFSSLVDYASHQFNFCSSPSPPRRFRARQLRSALRFHYNLHLFDSFYVDKVFCSLNLSINLLIDDIEF